MKNPHFRRGTLIALLTLSLTGNLWQFLARPTLDQDRAPERKPPLMVEAVDTTPATESAPPVEKSGDASASEEQPSEARENFASESSGLPPLAERRAPHEHPEDWIPPLSSERVKLADLRAMLTEEPPAGEVVELFVQIKDQTGTLADFGLVRNRFGQKSVTENIRELPFPTELDPPSLPPADEFPELSVKPWSPRAFDFKNTGWRIEFSTSARGGFIFIEGIVTSIGLSGFENAVGLPFRPIEDENGNLISENRVMLPGFATHEMPFVDAVRIGETLQMPVPALKGNALLEMTVKRVLPEE